MKAIILAPNKILDGQHLKFKDDLKSFYNLDHEIKIKRIHSLDLVGRFRDISHHLNRFQFIFNLIDTFYYAFQLSRTLNRIRPGIIYLRDINLVAWMKLFLRSDLKKNIAVELHYISNETLRRKRQVRILSKVNSIITITGQMKKQLQDEGLDKKILVEHDAVNIGKHKIGLTKEECRNKLGLDPKKLIIGYTGKFVTNGAEKGLYDVIRASKNLLVNFNIQFVFVGGPLSIVDSYLKLMDELEIDRNAFTFIDSQPVEMVPLYNKAFDILLMPLPHHPHFSSNMSPMKLFEYSVSGNPILGTMLPGIMEVLEDGKNSLLAVPGDWQNIEEKLFQLCESKEQRNSLGEEALKISEHYNWDARSRRILDYIQDSKTI